MDEIHSRTPGMEVEEHELNQQELGFLSGVFEAWANRTLTEADFRGAMEALAGHKSELDS